MGYLFDGWQPETRFLFDMHPEMLHGRIKTLMDTDYVIVINQTVSDTAHGVRYEPDGDPIKVICSVEGRRNQAGMFANSGQEECSPTVARRMFLRIRAVSPRSRPSRSSPANGPVTSTRRSGMTATCTTRSAALSSASTARTDLVIGRSELKSDAVTCRNPPSRRGAAHGVCENRP